MIRALAIKELRESVGLLAVAALGLLYVVLLCMGKMFFAIIPVNYGPQIAFISDPFNSSAGFVVGFFGILLGLKQSAWELNHNTFYLLIHRPLSRRKIIATKLAVGGLLTFGILAIAIVIYGSWAATPGNLAAPFEWSMTANSWRLALVLVVVFFGGFLRVIRRGGCFGSLLAPLVWHQTRAAGGGRYPRTIHRRSFILVDSAASAGARIRRLDAGDRLLRANPRLLGASP